MGESGRLPERFAAAFLFCPQRRISGAFRTPHRGLRFVIALANTTSISCGRFRAQLRAATSDSAPYIRLCGRLFPFIPCSFSGALLRAATSDSAPYIRLCGQTFSFSLLCPLPIRQVSICALGMTNIQKPSPALSPRSVLCGQTFSFYTLFFLRCAASRCDFRLCALYSSLRTDFFLFFAMPFTDTASIDLRARHDEYTKALARTLASFRPLRTDFFLLYLVLSQVRCFALRLPTLRLIFVSADRLFFLLFAMTFADTASIDLRRSA